MFDPCSLLRPFGYPGTTVYTNKYGAGPGLGATPIIHTSHIPSNMTKVNPYAPANFNANPYAHPTLNVNPYAANIATHNVNPYANPIASSRPVYPIVTNPTLPQPVEEAPPSYPSGPFTDPSKVTNKNPYTKTTRDKGESPYFIPYDTKSTTKRRKSSEKHTQKEKTNSRITHIHPENPYFIPYPKPAGGADQVSTSLLSPTLAYSMLTPSVVSPPTAGSPILTPTSAAPYATPASVDQSLVYHKPEISESGMLPNNQRTTQQKHTTKNQRPTNKQTNKKTTSHTDFSLAHPETPSSPKQVVGM